MKLKRMRIEQLRQFRKPFVLDNLQPGLNLIHGPNESGKSTLVPVSYTHLTLPTNREV